MGLESQRRSCSSLEPGWARSAPIPSPSPPPRPGWAQGSGVRTARPRVHLRLRLLGFTKGHLSSGQVQTLPCAP